MEKQIPKKKKEEIKRYKQEYIEKQKDQINNTINNIWNNTNKQVIDRLVTRINELTQKENINEKDENMINIENTIAISRLCQYYFEKELEESFGLPFFIYYFQKNQLLMKDIKDYINKKDWEKYEIEYIEKKQDLFLSD